MDMMKAILDIENKAQEVENSIDVFAGQIRLETDEKIKNLQSKADREANAEIEKYRAEVKAEEESELETAKAEMKETLDSLEQKFAQSRSKWIEDITAEITKGDTR